MTTFDDVPLARGADIELAAADARIHARRRARQRARQYPDLAYCRNTGWCWFCGEREAEPAKAPLIPMCDVCKRRREVPRE